MTTRRRLRIAACVALLGSATAPQGHRRAASPSRICSLYNPTWFRKAPFEDPADFAQRWPITHVKNIQTPLMFILGDEDIVGYMDKYLMGKPTATYEP